MCTVCLLFALAAVATGEPIERCGPTLKVALIADTGTQQGATVFTDIIRKVHEKISQTSCADMAIVAYGNQNGMIHDSQVLMNFGDPAGKVEKAISELEAWLEGNTGHGMKTHPMDRGMFLAGTRLEAAKADQKMVILMSNGRVTLAKGRGLTPEKLAKRERDRLAGMNVTLAAYHIDHINKNEGKYEQEDFMKSMAYPSDLYFSVSRQGKIAEFLLVDLVEGAVNRSMTPSGTTDQAPTPPEPSAKNGTGTNGNVTTTTTGPAHIEKAQWPIWLGVTLALVVGAILLALLIFYCRKKRSNEKEGYLVPTEQGSVPGTLGETGVKETM